MESSELNFRASRHTNFINFKAEPTAIPVPLCGKKLNKIAEMSSYFHSYYGKFLRSHSDSQSEKRRIATTPLQLTTAMAAKATRVQASASGVTDPGRPHKQNQDAFFLLQDVTNDAVILGVFDGHGRETGKDAAMTAKSFFEAHFRSFTAEKYEELEADPHAVFSRLFSLCHDMIKSVYRRIYEQRGYTVHDESGSLVRRDHDEDHDDLGVCIRGGTTATVVVLLHGGSKIITANVGDSAALVGASEPVLSSHDVEAYAKGKRTPKKRQATTDGLVPRFDDELKSEWVLLTGDHSADSESEFLRVRRHSCGIQEQEVQFVYDYCEKSPTCSRSTRKKRLPVFNVSPRGLVQQNMFGDYYKNVRDEWATIVTTPFEAPYPDSLAFTRSLGDFHMHNYGVSFEPTVRAISLEGLLSRGMKKSMKKVPLTRRPSPTSIEEPVVGSTGASDDATEATEFFLVVASDGVWDNWKYEELVAFLVEQSSTEGSSPSDPRNEPQSCRFWPLSPLSTQSSQSHKDQHMQSHVDRLALDLMDANMRRADRIFGDQADNMTAIVCHIRFSSLV